MKKRTIFFLAGLLTLFVIVGLGVFCYLQNSLVRSWLGGETSEIKTNKTAKKEVPDGKRRYSNTGLGFSLIIPVEIKLSGYREPGQVARVITFSMPEGDGRQFQIYIVPYKDDKITSSQIAKDTHGQTTGEPEDVLLNNDLHALTFLTEDPLLGTLREVWFLNNGYLYEVTASIDLDSWLLEIMQTWKFTR